MKVKTPHNSIKNFKFKPKQLSIAIALAFNPIISHAQFPANFELSTLDVTTGVVVRGENNSDFAGFSVSSIGDFNGDGFDDVIIGAYQSDAGSIGGITYVVFGNSTGLVSPLDVTDIDGTNGVVFLGEASRDRFGYSVNAAGDINNDGLADIIIGAPRTPVGSQLQVGSAYVIFGSTQSFTSPMNVSTLSGADGFVLLGSIQQDFLGTSVSAAGDLNGDMIDDVIIGAPWADPNGKNKAGNSYVVFGKSTAFASSINVSSLNGANGFKIQGQSTDSLSGTSVSAAGDFNGDNIDDVIIGALGAAANGNTFAGRTYVVFGKTSAFSSTLNLSGVSNTKAYVFKGVNAFDATGSSVSGIGDINGDGIDDILMGAPGNPSNGAAQTGLSFVVFGTTTVLSNPTELSNIDGSNGFVIEGINTDDSFGGSVKSVGDINGDGKQDIIIGATGASYNATNAGSSYVIFGKNTSFNTPLNVSSLNGSNGFALHGVSASNRSGISVSQAGDFNADGVTDLVIGSKNAGRSYIVFGQKKDAMFADGFE